MKTIAERLERVQDVVTLTAVALSSPTASMGGHVEVTDIDGIAESAARLLSVAHEELFWIAERLPDDIGELPALTDDELDGREEPERSTPRIGTSRQNGTVALIKGQAR